MTARKVDAPLLPGFEEVGERPPVQDDAPVWTRNCDNLECWRGSQRVGYISPRSGGLVLAVAYTREMYPDDLVDRLFGGVREARAWVERTGQDQTGVYEKVILARIARNEAERDGR